MGNAAAVATSAKLLMRPKSTSAKIVISPLVNVVEAQTDKVVDDDDDLFNDSVVDLVSELKCDGVVRSLNNEMSLEPETEEALQKLLALESQDPRNRIVLRRAGAASAVISTMKRCYIDSTVISELGLKALALLVIGDITFEQKVGELGACDVITDILKRYISIPSVAEHACFAIRKITNNCEANINKIGNNGGCQLLISTMRSHPTVEVIIEQCCMSITNLAKVPIFCAALENIGVCEVILHAAKNFPHSINVAVSIVKAMTNLASQPTCNTKLGEAGGCSVLVSVLVPLRQSPELADNGCRAMINMSSDANNRRLLGEVGACEALHSIFRGFSTHSAVIDQACMAVFNLSGLAANKKKFAASDLLLCVRAISDDGSMPEQTKILCQKLLKGL